MKFSVLISVYYKENALFLKEALHSIENQILSANEIVLVKDGPLTPELDSIIAYYGEHSQIPYKIIELKENIGLGEALNKGLKHCKHEWIARMDSDDIALPDRFEKQFAYLETHPDVDVLGAWISEFSDDPNQIAGERKSPCAHYKILKYAKYRNPLNHMTVVFRKNAVEAVGGYLPMTGFEDYYLWIRMLQKGYIFANLDQVLVDVRAGNEMIQRRRGLKYIKNEWAFEKAGWELGFFSTFELGRNMLMRVIPRLMPPFLLEKVYNALRKM